MAPPSSDTIICSSVICSLASCSSSSPKSSSSLVAPASMDCRKSRVIDNALMSCDLSLPAFPPRELPFAVLVESEMCTWPVRMRKTPSDCMSLRITTSPGAKCLGCSFRYNWSSTLCGRPLNIGLDSKISRNTSLATWTASARGITSMMVLLTLAYGRWNWWLKSFVTRRRTLRGTLKALRRLVMSSIDSLNSPARPLSRSASVAMLPTIKPNVVAPTIWLTMQIPISYSVTGFKSPKPTVAMVVSTQ
mmetsp:Transcript_9147/g.21338  ORF Transcript_9147/g.21338 Transcript_9147/m.21338 type:complete len:248 (-) Transcript_9147:1581-2324(-)